MNKSRKIFKNEVDFQPTSVHIVIKRSAGKKVVIGIVRFCHLALHMESNAGQHKWKNERKHCEILGSRRYIKIWSYWKKRKKYRKAPCSRWCRTATFTFLPSSFNKKKPFTASTLLFSQRCTEREYNAVPSIRVTSSVINNFVRSKITLLGLFV